MPPPPREAPAPDAAASAPKPTPRRDVEGAIGPVVSVNPEYQGGARTTATVIPGYFIRWGRYTATNTGGFVTRRDNDDVMRGLAADFVNSDVWRVNMALRLDHGRTAKDSSALTGVGNVRSTVRGRLIVTRSLPQGWSATIGTSFDMLGRGGGTLVDFGLNKGIALDWSAPWSRSTLNVGASVTGASRRYMQSYFGIDEQQSASSGYTVYSPSSGLRDGTLGINVRSEFGDRWVGYVGTGVSHLLGPARASPLSQQQSSWSVNAGVAWRF
jgi:outer membrane scaffolding protein for murein synthesis (MipA/OmpV family)